jgi:signal transduction histidine kinase
MARVQALARDPRQVDRIVAAAGFAGAWWNAASEPHRDLGFLAVWALAVLMGTIAWRRVNPVASTLVAAAALAAFQAVSLYNGDGTFEAAAIAFSFYILGQRARSRPRVRWCAACFAGWLGTAWLITFDPGPGSIGAMAGAFALFGPLPFACGLLLASRSLLTADLQHRSALLESEQERRSRAAAGEERNRMARELHDVIAHCLSVMVVQVSGARTVAATDPDRARAALRAVDSAGREALGDLRRLVGAIRHGGEPADEPGPGPGDFEVLADRARLGGLEVGVHRSGPLASLDPALSEVAYRVVQESLTNCMKHAGPVRADVVVQAGEAFLEIAVTDTGGGTPAHSCLGSGRGLAGMQERVRSHGGELHAGPRPEGGFEVRARIPLPGPPALESPARDTRAEAAWPAREGGRWRWQDAAFAGAALAGLEAGLLTSSEVRGPLAANALALLGFGVAMLWRRRYPLAFALAVVAIAGIMSAMLTPLHDLPVAAAFYLLVLPYAVASWATRVRAALGLGLVLGPALADQLVSHSGSRADLVGAAAVAVAAWGVGRAVRAARSRNATLGRSLSRLAAEGGDRTRLAVAGERSRLARDLHESLAGSISVMLVQAEVARQRLAEDPELAGAAMTAVEQTGREALADMRRILGALRSGQPAADLEPLPGIGQVYALIGAARNRGQRIELTVDGEPGDIPATVELGVFRLLEEALGDTGSCGQAPVRVCLVFGDSDLKLDITAPLTGAGRWPTRTMRERIALCGGQVEEARRGRDECQLAVRMPRAAEGALG